MATISTPQTLSQSAIALRSTVKLENSLTSSSSRSGDTATKWAALQSMPAALGWVIARVARFLPGLSLILRCVRPWLLRQSLCKEVPHRLRRLAHSLEREIGTAATKPPSPFTHVNVVTHNHANPQALCTHAVSVFCGTAFHLATTRAPAVFLRRDFRQRPDYFANLVFKSDAASTGKSLRRSFRFLVSPQRAAVSTAV